MMKKFLIFIFSLIFILPINIFALDLYRSSEIDINDNSFDSYDMFFSISSYDNLGNYDGHIYFTLDDDNKMHRYKLTLDNKLIYNDINYIDNDLMDARIIKKSENEEVKGNSDVLFVLYDDSLNVRKTFLYGGTGDEYGEIFGLPSLDDQGNIDGYLFVFVTTSTDIPGIKQGELMVKFDLNGNLVWQKNISFLKNYSKDGKISFSIEGTKLIKNDVNVLDSSQNSILWSVDTGSYLDDCIISYDKSGNMDGVIALYDGDYGLNPVLFKYDLDGKQIFKKELSNVKYASQLFLSKYVDGSYDGIMITTNTDEYGYGTATISKYDFNGNFVWKDEYNPTEYGGVMINSTEMIDFNGKFNGYLVLARQNNCPAPAMRKVENAKFSKSSPTIKKLGNKDAVCFGYKFFRYTYPSYEIVKGNNENGVINVNNMAYPGEVVKVSVTPKKGYTLKRIVVKDESGKEIEVSKDGTFIMPEGKVTVTAIYNRISNPETVSACYVVLGIILLISIGTLIVQKKKEIV